jgi:class 3 adenylate cyclase/tetratricopeptide (TPR) repeat protein
MPSSVTATFVFTDLVDSTATAARLGPEDAEALRQTHFKLLRGAVAASGGTEVKNLGDGLMVMYSSPSRALAGAVGMQQAIEGHNRAGKEPLGVRIGISAGEATEEDDDYFGDPVVEAARLCAASHGGQILAADVVRVLVGRHATQTFVDVGDLELKGLPDPVPAVEVQWEPVSVAGSVPMPGRLAGAATNALFGFFGRSPELEQFADARKRARTSGQCQAVLVAGEAGMGKTSLVAQAARAAQEEGAVVLFGHSDEDLGVAYQPWIEVLSSLVRHTDPEVLGSLRSAQRSALARLVPDLAGVDTGDRVADPDTERLLLLEGTVELLAAGSSQEPVMVVLDDLHWADTASLQVFRHVVTSTTPTNLTIAVTYRDTDLGRNDPLTLMLADLHREPNVTRFGLRGLDDTDLMELLAAAAGHDLDDSGIGLAHALRRETDGNPFFTGEILRHLGESGRIVLGDDGRWTVPTALDEFGLPTSVRDVVGRRVARLGEEVLRVLTLAAVIGREFDVSLLGELADVDEDPLLDHLDAAVSAAILDEGSRAGRYRFVHALMQHSLYDELSPTRRERAHRRIAETIEARPSASDANSLAELARHWIAATRPADTDKALHYARLAGDAARDALAPDDAARWYEQALDLLRQQPTPQVRQHVELMVDLGRVQRTLGRADYRRTLVEAFEIAQRSGDEQLIVSAGLGFAMFRGALVGDAEAQRALSAALPFVPPDPTPTRARMLAALAESYDAAAQAEERRTYALEAVEAARRAGDDAAFVDVLLSVYYAVETPDRRDQAIADLERMIEIVDRMDDPVQQARARYRVLWVHYQHVDVDAADRVLGELDGLEHRIGLPFVSYETQLLRTGRLLLAGDADAAEASNETMLELGNAAGAAEAIGSYGGLVYAICEHRGTTDTIVEFFVQAAVDNPSIVALQSAVTMLLADLGRLDEASARLDAELAAGFGDYPYDGLWLVTMSNLADAAATTGRTDVSRALVELLRPFADHVVSTGATVNGAMARCLGRAATVLGDFDQAEGWFQLAHDVHAKLHAPFWIARAQLDHAHLCLARRADGDLERARELITTAAATAAEFGCAGLTRRADALLTEI